MGAGLPSWGGCRDSGVSWAERFGWGVYVSVFVDGGERSTVVRRVVEVNSALYSSSAWVYSGESAGSEESAASPGRLQNIAPPREAILGAVRVIRVLLR